MAAFLSYNEYRCGHEQAILLRSISDLKRLFAIPYSGTVETAAAQAWRLIKHHVPHARHVVVLRNVDDVMESMLRINTAEFSYDANALRRMLEYGDRMLHEVARQPGVLTLLSSDLDTEYGCRAIFERCLPYRFDRGWWLNLKGKNIQCNVQNYIRYYHEHKTEVENFKSLLWKDMRRLRRDNLITRH
jgi:hypothetical protein